MKKIDQKLLSLIEQFKYKTLPSMPVNAKVLMDKYYIPEGKDLGNKLKIIEEEWINNNFHISKEKIDKIINR